MVEAEQTMGRVQFAVFKNLVEKVAEKNDFNIERLTNLHRGSVVFGNELEDIVKDSTVHFKKMRKQTTQRHNSENA
jgi:hypothetical protein